MKITHCESCGADMIFAVNQKSGKSIPLDAQPERRYVIIEEGENLICRFVNTYLTHFATCPNADQHRKPRLD